LSTKPTSDNDERKRIAEYLARLMRRTIHDKQITAIEVNPLYHGSPRRWIEVGRHYAELEPEAPSQLVIAIFESDSFLVCTPERGAGKGLPYIFTREEVKRVRAR
jgi:hypothetical protein